MLYKVSILSSADRQPNPCQVDGWWDYRKLSANPKGSPLPWGEFSDRKDRLACCKFWKEPLRGSRVLYFVDVAWIFFTSKRNHILSPFIFFVWLNTLKVAAKAPIADLLRLNTLQYNVPKPLSWLLKGMRSKLSFFYGTRLPLPTSTPMVILSWYTTKVLNFNKVGVAGLILKLLHWNGIEVVHEHAACKESHVQSPGASLFCSHLYFVCVMGRWSVLGNFFRIIEMTDWSKLIDEIILSLVV